MSISVNRLTDADLRRELVLIPRLPRAARDAIANSRPFADAADMCARVNHGALPQQCVGKRHLKHFDFAPADINQPPRTRNVEYARELLALHIRVPWSAWDGYDDDSGYEIGIVWDYNPHARRFTVRFPPRAECNDIGMTWEELRGEALCHSSATERALLDESPNDPPVNLTPQPRKTCAPKRSHTNTQTQTQVAQRTDRSSTVPVAVLCSLYVLKTRSTYKSKPKSPNSGSWVARLATSGK